jgi:nitrogenase subunit NifH
MIRIISFIEKFCTELEIPVLGRLPYDDIATKAMLQEQTVIEYAKNSEHANESEFANKVREIWAKVEKTLMDIPDKQKGIKIFEIKKF